MHTSEEKNGVVKEAIVLQWAVRIAWCDFKPRKSDGLVHCSVKNAAVLCENHRETVTQIWTGLPVGMNTWSMLWQSVWTHTPMMSSLSGFTLHLSFHNNTVSPLIHASHGHILYTDCLTVHLISCTPVSSSLYLVWLVAYDLNLIW